MGRRGRDALGGVIDDGFVQNPSPGSGTLDLAGPGIHLPTPQYSAAHITNPRDFHDLVPLLARFSLGVLRACKSGY